jgi:hypothetical protein
MEGLAELYPAEIAHEPRQVPRLHRVVTEGRMGIEVLATVVAEPFSPMEAVAIPLASYAKHCMMGTQLSLSNPRNAIQEYLFSKYFGFWEF